VSLSRENVPAGLMEFLKTSEAYRVDDWTFSGALDPETGEYKVEENRVPSDLDPPADSQYRFLPPLLANLVSSEVKGKTDVHRPVLDIDVPAYLVPSSRPGHSHLYVNVEISEDKYFNLLDVLADCGILEKGYAGVSRARGASAVRVEFEPASGYKITITLDEEELSALESFLNKVAPFDEYEKGDLGLDVARTIYYAIP
jgi:hypothetical protein